MPIPVIAQPTAQVIPIPMAPRRRRVVQIFSL
jgi:hypothetical protein